jgi:chromosome partitioning protein
MHIVSVINYKGGVGKTSLTTNLAAELAYRGKKILLIDLDAQASLTFSSPTCRAWRLRS